MAPASGSSHCLIFVSSPEPFLSPHSHHFGFVFQSFDEHLHLRCEGISHVSSLRPPLFHVLWISCSFIPVSRRRRALHDHLFHRIHRVLNFTEFVACGPRSVLLRPPLFMLNHGRPSVETRSRPSPGHYQNFTRFRLEMCQCFPRAKHHRLPPPGRAAFHIF